MKDGDKIVVLANLINLEVMVDLREKKRKELKLIIWKQDLDIKEGG